MTPGRPLHQGQRERLDPGHEKHPADQVGNAGGIKYAYGIQNYDLTPEESQNSLAAIGPTIAQVLSSVEREGVTPLDAAYAIAQQRIDDAQRQAV
jgi:hypothetical protein